MGVIKFQRDTTDLFNYPSDQNPTTQEDYIRAVKNWQETERNLVDSILWQPETAYSVGNIVKTPSLPSQYVLVCTEAGDSGVAEPDYTEVSVGDTVVDGTATWLVSTIVNGGNIDALTTAVEANTQAIGEHSTAIATNTQNIATNTADIATNTANIATNTEDIANNTTDIEIADKRISNIEKLLQGNLYDYQTDTDSAYTKTVPAGAMPYAGLEKLGGKTLVWNQLAPNDASTETLNGVTFTNNGDGSWTVNGTASADIQKKVNVATMKLKQGHKYLIRGCPSGGSTSTYRLNLAAVTNDTGSGVIFTWSNADNISPLQIFIVNGYSASNLTFYPQYVDLTLCYGSGNEPTTVAEFIAQFPAQYYPYNAGTLLSAGVTEVVSKKADTTTIATYPIPAEIQSLEGYGWSAGSVYNYIDYERKVFVQNVKRIDCSNYTWTLQSINANNIANFQCSTNFSDLNIANRQLSLCNTLSEYQTTTISNTTTEGFFINGSRVFFLRISSAKASTVEQFTTWLTNNPTFLQYPLATPIETDISAYLTDDNLIEVEAGGTLTFQNQHGDNYRIPVPSSEEYMINLQEAVSNG